MNLRKELAKLGYSEMFIKRAMVYEPMFSGSLELFLVQVTDILEEEPDTTGGSPAAGCSMDKGAVKTEIDYEGDAFTSSGFRRG